MHLPVQTIEGQVGTIGVDTSAYTGPDAPDMVAVPLDRKIVFHLSNDPDFSNNVNLDYTEKVLGLPEGTQDSLYKFEGYLVYQLAHPDVPLDLEYLTDRNLARVVFQSDLQNDITKAYNWFAEQDPFSGDTIYYPELVSEGANEGLRHSFVVEEDAFGAPGDDSLKNGEFYYYLVIAYAYNNFRQFDPFRPETGQPQTALASTRNLRVYEVSPKETPDTLQYNANYGDAPQVIRIEGAGNHGQNLIPEGDFHELVLDGSFDGEIPYLEGHGPLDVKIVDPVSIRDGVIEIEFFDSDPFSENLLEDTRFTATDLSTGEEIISHTTIEIMNEVLLQEFGISVLFGPIPNPGADPFLHESNGFVNAEIVYPDAGGPQWLSFLKNRPQESGEGPNSFNFIKTGELQNDFDLDPNQVFTKNNQAGFYPYCLLNYRTSSEEYISPAWVNSQNIAACSGSNDGFERLNNVDIVFTSDRSKWSRTIVVEGANIFYPNEDMHFTNFMFDLLERPTASIEAGPDGEPLDDPGLPDGYSWFPGYAIDVETGERLNLFFAENTRYSPDNPSEEISSLDAELLNGDDRMWNPGSKIEVDLPGIEGNYAGGQHFIYVTNQKYDGCESLHEVLGGPLPGSIKNLQVIMNVTWAGIPLAEGLLSYEEGLIPNEAIVRLRVDKPYRVVSRNAFDVKNYNLYQIVIDGKEPGPPTNVINEFPPSVQASLLKNPGRENLTVTVEGALEIEFDMEVYNLNGSLLYQSKRNFRENTVDASTWPSGMYLVRVFMDDYRPSTLKWIKGE